MKLESSPIGDDGTGMVQIQSQLDNITIQLHDIGKKRKHKNIFGARSVEQMGTLRITI